MNPPSRSLVCDVRLQLRSAANTENTYLAIRSYRQDSRSLPRGLFVNTWRRDGKLRVLVRESEKTFGIFRDRRINSIRYIPNEIVVL